MTRSCRHCRRYRRTRFPRARSSTFDHNSRIHRSRRWCMDRCPCRGTGPRRRRSQRFARIRRRDSRGWCTHDRESRRGRCRDSSFRSGLGRNSGRTCRRRYIGRPCTDRYRYRCKEIRTLDRHTPEPGRGHSTTTTPPESATRLLCASDSSPPAPCGAETLSAGTYHGHAEKSPAS